IHTVQGDMRDLSQFPDGTFDLIVHPCSNGFIPDVNPVWRECFRVIRPGGQLMTGFVNPLFYIFDYWEMEKGRLQVAYKIPYSDEEQLTDDKRQSLIDQGEPMEFGHSLEDQIGGQLRAGFHLTSLFEDHWDDSPAKVLSQYIDGFLATLAMKPV
ncbi:MAG: class I SAM-dependent methyltransferase, partial [Pirellulaceae bacterium]